MDISRRGFVGMMLGFAAGLPFIGNTIGNRLRYRAVLDEHTLEECSAADGAWYTITKHYHAECRCVLTWEPT